MTRSTFARLALGVCLGAGLSFVTGQTQDAPPQEKKKQRVKRPPPPGVSTPGVRREMSDIKPMAVFDAESGTPDWQVVTEDSVWVANGPKNVVHRLDVKTNRDRGHQSRR